MAFIKSIEARGTFEGPMPSFDAEAVLMGVDGSDLYAHYNEYDGFKNYTVGKESLMGDVEGEPEYIEAYHTLAAAKKAGSKYYKVFQTLTKALNMLGMDE